jgi:hypothetical protein
MFFIKKSISKSRGYFIAGESEWKKIDDSFWGPMGPHAVQKHTSGGDSHGLSSRRQFGVSAGLQPAAQNLRSSARFRQITE